MLQHLSIRNYVLIDQLAIDFAGGFSAITGETGAGKSILLGALGLLLGQRADRESLMHRDKKCVIEAHFDVSKLQLASFFQQHDLDEEHPCIIRREINPKGKSRAFVNDTPVPLQVLKALGQHIMDIHSQSQSLQMQSPAFRLQMIDAFADHQPLLQSYQGHYHRYQSLNKELQQLQQQLQQQQAEQDYHQFLYDEIESLQLQPHEQEALEKEQQLLQHAEDIMDSLYQLSQRLVQDDNSISSELQLLEQQTQRISQYQDSINTLHARLLSAQIELQDIGEEAASLQNDISINPERMTLISQRLSDIFRLCQKHQLPDANALISKHQTLRATLAAGSNLADKIHQLTTALADTETQLRQEAQQLFEGRKKAIQHIEQTIGELFKALSMPNAKLQIQAEQTQEIQASGMDSYTYLFSANKGSQKGDLSKIASGGEMSRIMLSLKYMLAQKKSLPTILFDEIDTGVSGEIAGKLARLIQSLGQHLQVIAITHLPQVAAKATQHYKVYKTHEGNTTHSHLQRLQDPDRQKEIAAMLSGDTLSASALQHAKALLQTNKDKNRI